MGDPATIDDFVGSTVWSETYDRVSFRLEHTLGTGATATAFFATRTSPQGISPAVVKVILPKIVAQGGETATIVVRKEAVALGRLNERIPPTPFVVRFLDAGTIHVSGPRQGFDLPWLAIEYVHGGVEGTTLEDRVRFSVTQCGYAFDRQRAASAVRQVCEGLAEVHDVGVIHRDLNPNNVLCCGFGDAELFKLSDFGIARPIGMEATLGATVMGTPGYISPEQGFQIEGGTTAVSDIFSLGGITFFILTGQAYFDSRSPVEALVLSRDQQRRSLLDCPTLCPELRSDPESARALDAALARATAPEPSLRPQSARAFAASVLPWLETAEPASSVVPQVSMAVRARAAFDPPSWIWSVRHPPGDDRIVHSVGWDVDGCGLAAVTEGLAFWDGTHWLSVSADDLPVAEGVRFVFRLDHGRWLIGGDHATLAEYSRAGVTRILRGPDRRLAFTCGSGDIADLAVVVGTLPGYPPQLCALSGGRWLKPYPVEEAATLSAVSRIDDTRWLVAGRGVDGRAYAAVFEPLMWHLHRVATPEARALVACASLPERETAVAVGSHGAVVRVEHGQTRVMHLDASPNLAAATIDVLDRLWVGGAGNLWVSSAHGEGWMRVWRDAAWHAPFISIYADVGLVVAMTADGGVLECRTRLASVGLPPIVTSAS